MRLRLQGKDSKRGEKDSSGVTAKCCSRRLTPNRVQVGTLNAEVHGTNSPLNDVCGTAPSASQLARTHQLRSVYVHPGGTRESSHALVLDSPR